MKGTQWYIGAPNGVVLCIREFHPDALRGELYHSYSAEAVPFANAQQMILEMERLYDRLNFPHPGTNERSFTKPHRSGEHITERDKIMKDEELLSKHGDMGSFIIRVQQRQNSSMQGRLTWIEKNKTVHFRSVWELIRLIDSAVEMDNPIPEGELPTWED